MPHRKPLATLDPQSAHSWLTEDMTSPSSSSRLPTDSKDAVANRFGRQIVSRGSIGDEGVPIQSASSSRKNSLSQNLSGISLSRNESRRPSLASSVSTRRASVPTIHLKGSPSTAISPPISTPPQITHSAYTINDELYSGLKNYSFGAPGITRPSSPDSDIYESNPPSRYTEQHQRPRRSLSSVPTPRDEMEIDEAEISRHSRAKMRAIDDGGRRPSLPKNPTSSPPAPSLLPVRASSNSGESRSSTDHVMDDRSSTYTFGVPAMYHHSDSEQSSYLDEEPLDQLSTSPVTFAYTPPGAGDDDEVRRNSFVVPIGHGMRRESIPMAIPETPRQNNRTEMITRDEIQAMRKLSRSLDDEISTLGLGETPSTDQPGGSARSEPFSKADWSSFQQVDSRSTPSLHTLRRLSTQQAEEEGNPNAYIGLDLAYIFGSDGGGGPRGSWSAESFVQRRPSVAQPTTGFGGFALSFGRDVDRRPSVATAGEDTFLRHLQHNDANYALRLEEWTFAKEKADAPGPRLSGLTAGGVVAPTIGPGTYEIWRCHAAGRFNVERLALQSDPPKPHQHRMVVKHIPDPYSANRRGGPGVIVHKHSQAKAFSIFRSHGLFKPKQAQKPGQGPRHLDTSQSILLATKNVQEQYTSTKTTGRLKTHGLLEDHSAPAPSQPQPSEGSPGGSSEQGGPPASVRRSRSHSLVRKDKGKTKSHQKEDKKKKEKGKEKEKKEGKRKDGAGSQTSSREGIAVVTKDGFWSRLPGRHSATPSSSLSNNPAASGSATTTDQSASSTSYSTTPTPTSTTNSSPIIPEDPVPASIPPFRPSFHPRIPSSSHSNRSFRSELWEEDEDEVYDEYHVPVQKRSHAEIYASLPPLHHEQARNLIRSNHPSIATGSRPRFPKIFPRKGGSPSDWLPNSPTTSLVPSPVPWMLTNNSNSQQGQMVMSNLNDNFGAVGLVPPRPYSQRLANKPRGKTSEGLILPVPDDSVYMLLPLFAGETDAEFQPEDMSQYEVPLESRKYLLVYYVPFDKRMDGGRKKKAEPPVMSNSVSERAKNKIVFLSSFRVSAHLMTYQDFKGSGIRLPATGLSVTGSLAQAQPPNVEPEMYRDPIALAQCSKRDNGIEFLPEGLHKLGLCHAEQVEQMVDPDDLDDDDDKVEYQFELSALGRAVVEMAWVGAMAVTSFGTT